MREASNFGTFSQSCSTFSSWLCQDGNCLFALATDTGVILLIKLPPPGSGGKHWCMLFVHCRLKILGTDLENKKKINYFVQVSIDVFSAEHYFSTLSRSNWNLEVLVFEERAKPEKNLLEHRREPTANSVHMYSTAQK